MPPAKSDIIGDSGASLALCYLVWLASLLPDLTFEHRKPAKIVGLVSAEGIESATKRSFNNMQGHG